MKRGPIVIVAAAVPFCVGFGCGARTETNPDPDATLWDASFQDDVRNPDASPVGDASRHRDAVVQDAVGENVLSDIAAASDAPTLDATCLSDAGRVDAGRLASCVDNPCGSGQFCVYDAPSFDGGDGFASCQDIPLPCACSPTCACVETWTPELVCAGGPACSSEGGELVVTCEQQFMK
jgi:hypothetical protein